MRQLWSVAFALLFAPVSAASAAQPAPTASVECVAPDRASLNLSFDEFDQGEAGWRRWAANGCERQGAALIVEYRDLNSHRLEPSQASALDWHAGQLYAAAGDYGFAIERMLLAKQATVEPAELEYINATIAFLRSDREDLLAARQRMVAIPEPTAFSRAADQYVATYNRPRPVWPLNLDVVDGMISCFGWSYQRAYSCRAENEP
jgi:hypothetical protein